MQTTASGFNSFRPVWTSAPLLRLLVPLMLGIIMQWYLQVPIVAVFILAISFFIATVILSFFKQLVLSTFIGIGLQAILVCVGMLLVFVNDTSKRTDFIARKYTANSVLVATLQEPLNEKAKSYKAEASVQILKGDKLEKLSGNIILYFQKDSTKSLPALGYGSQVIFRKSLMEIKNAGNPGGFDYQRYCAFHNLYYQVFLKENEYDIGHQKTINPFWQDLFSLRDWSLSIFKKYIPGNTEAGMAEALLIGYRNDLDREIVQQYTNTGVVHIIAISGMHLGLIYALVLILFKPFSNKKHTKIVKAFAVIAVLWGFSLLTGAAPSITRSAIMFTFLVLGEIGNKKAGIYNSLACAAFLLLLYDPFTLWDVGFQLSFSALLSIAIFAKPIEQWFYFGKDWKRAIWKLNAVTLSAQVLTFPIVVFHFHQFPNLFLLTNMLAVPFSSLIIYVLIALLALSWVPFVNIWLGRLSKEMIWLMNKFIALVNNIPYALTDNIYFTLPQIVMLVMMIATFSFWLLNKSRKAFIAGLISFFVFMVLEIFQDMHTEKQKQLVVYNVPQHAAIDIIDGKKYAFYGDDILQEDGFLQNFHLKPSRVAHQVTKIISLKNVVENERCIQFGNKKLIWVDQIYQTIDPAKIETDIVIITGNPKLKLYELVENIHPTVIIADGTNSYYKIAQWQKQADSLHLRFHSVADKGAFVMDWEDK